ncbi:hypothetical protein [Thalassoglobus polymorphus]|uniref:Phage virion morphogenesis family protein n=1 Tax=Thalassoglobus polymorphus TaxID=2527994 RepID=A0A517QH25_9PLAN|nr:hypothetical protein [Thalassoglobus polymorphus]QDT30934.1 hypothetical protein Mal48_01630 [Thalassoglobus polymorphus]QDT30979.1 hypothetical protein Mal48_02080 [Thalassoglobus polymorphus]
MTIDLKSYQKNYFLDRAAVKDAVLAGKIRSLKRGGGLVRTIARRSIKKSRRVALSEMSPRSQAIFKNKQKKYRALKRKGKAGPYGPPKRPYKKAEPGEPPRSPSGFLKRFLFFGYDVPNEEVIIGPIRSKTGTVRHLEHGGRATLPNSRGRRVPMTFKGNPFMKPALKTAAPNLPDQFKNSIR